MNINKKENIVSVLNNSTPKDSPMIPNETSEHTAWNGSFSPNTQSENDENAKI